MKNTLILLCIIFGFVAASSGQARSPKYRPTSQGLEASLPAEAKKEFDQFKAESSTLRGRYEKDLNEIRGRSVKKLKVIQDKYTRDAKLDEAVAVREVIRQIQGVVEQMPRIQESEIGRIFMMEVEGAIMGQAWGDNPYTADSNVNTAAVHAGLVKPGQKAMIQIEVTGAQETFPSSTENGVTTGAWQAWPIGFRLRKSEN